MRPMDPAELVSKAEELFATFEPAKMSLDAHADAKIEEVARARPRRRRVPQAGAVRV